MKTTRHARRREGGAVAVIFGLSVIVLFAMGGLVLDLGHLYIAKAELQNAADAAALAGAKDIDQSAAGITTAVATAKAVAAKNKYNFSTTVTLVDANISFSADPDGPWSTVAQATASPSGMSFMQVDTGAKVMDTYLMRVAGVDTVSTSGVAVAGRFITNVTPIGVCAVDPVNQTAKYTYPAAPAGTGLTELVEFGFRRGVVYNLFELNPLSGSPSDPYLINPVNSPPGVCDPANSSASFTAPFMCNGNSAVMASGVGQVYTNTGLSAMLAASLNSRFDDFGGPSVCLPTSAPPDSNIKEYPCRGSLDTDCINNVSGNIATTPPINWMDSSAAVLPIVQQVDVTLGMKPAYQLPAVSSTPAPNASDAQFAGYGVLWSYGPAYQASTATPPGEGTAFTTADANANPMYSTAKPAVDYFDTTASTKYPTSAGSGWPAGTPPSPYNQTSGTYFQAPNPSRPGQRNRRVLNIVLVDCRVAPTGSASCGAMDAVGVGKFFMTTKADFSGAVKRLNVEFVGLVNPVPTAEIKLYR